MWRKRCSLVREHKLTTILRRFICIRWHSSGCTRRRVATWGNGDFGRLGLGRLKSEWTPKSLPSPVFKNQNVISVSCGGAHTLFLTDDGRVYATGHNDFGQLGISEDCRYSLDPKEVFGLKEEIKKIYAGYHHSCALTGDGQLYMWGSNSGGQLGLGKRTNKVVPFPTKIESLSGITIKMAALALEHSVAVTDTGETLSWGAGPALGHDHESKFWDFIRNHREYMPRLVKSLKNIKMKHVAAGLVNWVCVDENGSLFVLGEGNGSVLGHASHGTALRIMGELPSCQAAACGGHHTCAITKDGELYGWGWNENGCLGVGSSDELLSPQRIDGSLLNSPVNEVSCGWKHTAAISDGKLFTWGWGGSVGTFSDNDNSPGGQLGHGNDVDYFTPTLVNFGKNAKVVNVSCGFNHTAAVVEVIEM